MLASLPLCLTFFATTGVGNRNLRAGPPRATLASDDAVVTAPMRSTAELLAVHPDPDKTPREVIDVMMSALHRDHLNSLEHPFLGSEVALRFLSTTHQVPQRGQSGRLGGAIAGHHGPLRLHLKA